ncbi:MAG: 3-hydroxyacyl-CoA dehydrogenase NAD-binding domain-containing protein [Symbiobacteriia bacterium]
MARAVRKAAVLGAGVMGAQIAAHLANVGIPSVLLDIVPRELSDEEKKKGLTPESPEFRNRFALGALKKLRELKPSPIYSPDSLNLIQPGNFEDHLSWVKDADWIVEAVVENLGIKQELWQKVETHWQPGAVVSSNTSGISINAIAAKNSPEFQKHFLGTHFFNPPRYMKLLEVIPTPATDPEIVSFITEFGERVLGKGVVLCKDTPNFIANRVGTYGLMVTLHAMRQFGLGVDEVDALTGPVMGRPKSATFRTLDIVGLDTMAHVANNTREAVTEEWEKQAFEIPDYLQEMIKRGWLGDKTGQGFFRKVKSEAGKEIFTLDLNTLEYKPRAKAKFASLEAAKVLPEAKQRLRALVYGQDKAGEFVWTVTKRVLLYAAAKAQEIADDIVSIDKAMRWGFNWDKGPFETWDLIGVRKSVERMRAEGETIPPLVEELLAGGHDSFYQEEPEHTLYFSLGGKDAAGMAELAEDPRKLSLARLKAQNKVIKAKPGASLIDIGDDVACLEFHSPKQAIGTDIITMMQFASQEVPKNYRGLVITSQAAPNFCVGANIAMMLMEAQDDNWDDIDLMVRQFQGASQLMRAMERPVVVAPYGITVGGGVEICFGADQVQAAGETYMGLVEVGVGLIPGGGGTKEMTFRALEGQPTGPAGIGGALSASGGPPIDLQPLINRNFETVAMAKVSTSAREAQGLGYLRSTDRISVGADHQLYDAKQAVLHLDRLGYRPPQPRVIPVIGPDGRAVIELGLYSMFKSGYISEHDLFIGKKLAFVMTGGNLPAGTLVTEQYLLDLEREAFLSLIGTQKTQARMQHMLTKGKALRN